MPKVVSKGHAEWLGQNRCTVNMYMHTLDGTIQKWPHWGGDCNGVCTPDPFVVCVPPVLPQELVNLLLCDVAVSNVFNGVMELDSGGTENVMCEH